MRWMKVPALIQQSRPSTSCSAHVAVSGPEVPRIDRIDVCRPRPADRCRSHRHRRPTTPAPWSRASLPSTVSAARPASWRQTSLRATVSAWSVAPCGHLSFDSTGRRKSHSPGPTTVVGHPWACQLCPRTLTVRDREPSGGFRRGYECDYGRLRRRMTIWARPAHRLPEVRRARPAWDTAVSVFQRTQGLDQSSSGRKMPEAVQASHTARASTMSPRARASSVP